MSITECAFVVNKMPFRRARNLELNSQPSAVRTKCKVKSYINYG